MLSQRNLAFYAWCHQKFLVVKLIRPQRAQVVDFDRSAS